MNAIQPRPDLLGLYKNHQFITATVRNSKLINYLQLDAVKKAEALEQIR